jgi:hypothetical protein
VSILIDPPPSAGAPKCLRGSACHMVSDLAGLAGTRELIAFALRLGLCREWLQAAGTAKEHFGLTPESRRVAMRLGAVEVSRRRMSEVIAGKREDAAPHTTIHPPATRRRHSWGVERVEVPWSAAGGNLRTCRRCGMTRQSLPDGTGRRWKVEFGILLEHGVRRYVRGRTPPCSGSVPNSALDHPREATSEGPEGGWGVQDFSRS